jgi:hypothetical protein
MRLRLPDELGLAPTRAHSANAHGCRLMDSFQAVDDGPNTTGCLFRTVCTSKPKPRNFHRPSADNLNMGDNVNRVADIFCRAASLAYAARRKRMGRDYFTTAVMAVSVGEGAVIQPMGRMPCSI